MSLLSCMRRNQTATSWLDPQLAVDTLQFALDDWQTTYERQLSADEEANQQTLQQMEQDVAARQARRPA